jgi:hypothetical protein
MTTAMDRDLDSESLMNRGSMESKLSLADGFRKKGGMIDHLDRQWGSISQQPSLNKLYEPTSCKSSF